MVSSLSTTTTILSYEDILLAYQPAQKIIPEKKLEIIWESSKTAEPEGNISKIKIDKINTDIAFKGCPALVSDVIDYEDHELDDEDFSFDHSKMQQLSSSPIAKAFVGLFFQQG